MSLVIPDVETPPGSQWFTKTTAVDITLLSGGYRIKGMTQDIRLRHHITAGVGQAFATLLDILEF
jgi:hypothetical protein